MNEHIHIIRIWGVLIIILISLMGLFAYTHARIALLQKENKALSQVIGSTTVALLRTSDSLERTTQDLVALRRETLGLSETLTSTKEDVAQAHDTLSEVKNQVGGVEEAVGSISGTVSTLKKLSTIDPELLKKYSKVYFLNENYTPAHLMKIPQEYVYSNTKEETYLTEALPFLERMLEQAKTDKVDFYVYSAYRSFAKQQSLKTIYSVIYGAGTANSFSADQGYSEHQLGTTVDFINPGSNGQLTTSFGETPSFVWLTQNAYKYGFVLSYPEKNSYYIYEPWHWRFVGVGLATALHENKINFYDMDQRDIDARLAELFDPIR